MSGRAIELAAQAAMVAAVLLSVGHGIRHHGKSPPGKVSWRLAVIAGLGEILVLGAGGFWG